MTRLLLDASVLLSATVARPGTPISLLLDAVEDGKVQMVACEHLLDEVRRGLNGPYFRERLPADDREAVLTGLKRIAVMRDDPASPPSVLRDPDDNYLPALALDASAEAIVTGDRDLLDHVGLEPDAITPREACRRLGLAVGETP
ncbi:MAG: putative toxin-antitoxin system toxin component, PIN family [Solirubrobacterales bacterium]